MRGHDRYEQLFKEAAPRLWRVLRTFCEGRGDIAEEAVAEAFVRALRRGKAVIDPEAWMYRVAFRLARRELKRQARVEPLNQQTASLDPAEQVDARVDLSNALQKLSPKQRLVIVLHYQEDLAVSEVARFLGISQATVRVHLHRGRRRLEQLLGSSQREKDEEEQRA